MTVMTCVTGAFLLKITDSGLPTLDLQLIVSLVGLPSTQITGVIYTSRANKSDQETKSIHEV